MSGLHHILLIAVLVGCDVLGEGHSFPFSPPLAHLVQDDGRAQPHSIQESVGSKPHSIHELVRAQPHSVHDIGQPQIHETSHSKAATESNSSQTKPPQSSVFQDIARPRSIESDDQQGQPDSPDPEMEHHGGLGATDSSLEASGFYGTDTDDRDRGEEGEERESRGGGEGGEERGREEDTGVLWDDLEEVNHTAPDLDALIGYSPSFLHTSGSHRDSGLSSTATELRPGPQELRAPLPEMVPLQRELWETEGEEEGQASGYGLFHSSITTTTTTTTNTTSTTTTTTSSSTTTATAGPDGAAAWDSVGTATPDADTDHMSGLVNHHRMDAASDHTAQTEEEEEEEDEGASLTHPEVFPQNPTVPEVGVAPSREPLQPSRQEEEGPEQEEEENADRIKLNLTDIELEFSNTYETDWKRKLLPLTTDPAPSPTTNTVNILPRDWLEQTTTSQSDRSEVRGGGVTELLLPEGEPDDTQEAQQVVCVEWSELAGRGYVILNMTDNLNCEEFRAERGVRLLEILERAFARRMNSPEGSWELYLSKPTHHEHQLLMNVASEHGVIETKDVLIMLGEIRRGLHEVGVQNYSGASSCQTRPSPTRSDYGKLFIVLVIIGSICMVIITSGLLYICWQRRLPNTKTMSRAEELHFVENGCHDNPTLDVSNDAQPEMQEKKPSTNGLAGGGAGGGAGGREDGTHWKVFVNQAGKEEEEEEEEQDTHL